MQHLKNALVNRLFDHYLLVVILFYILMVFMYGIINYNIPITIPQATANTILIIAGLFLWLTAYRLSRHKYYSKRLFH